MKKKDDSTRSKMEVRHEVTMDVVRMHVDSLQEETSTEHGPHQNQSRIGLLQP